MTSCASRAAHCENAVSNGETWIAEARNLNSRSLCENPIHRRSERKSAELRRLQAARKAALPESRAAQASR